ncbi:molybdopterin-dependent oxidoreductase [Occultella kanbiaonis]|uniref:molybdopterin-dependent oxidoreductase n=1 Tax=Occultella kanbiaonis TaxID=2675754 RepID=UPI0013D71AD0|nr:molybdopterin-dependent oxidoreductase [Occultella kanbiaonis]
MTPATTRRPRVPSRPFRAAVGVVSAVAGIGIAHLVAALTVPAASPLLAVGSVAVDAAPTAVKEWAIATFGTADKPVLLGGIGATLLVVTALIGLIGFRRRWLGLAGMVLLGVVAAVAAAVRTPQFAAVAPAAVAALVSSITLTLVVRATQSSPSADGTARAVDGAEAPASSPLAGPNVRAGRFLPNRRSLLLAGPVAVAVAGIGSGAAIGAFRASDDAVGRDRMLPSPTSAAGDLPAGVQPDVRGITPYVTDNADFYRVDIALTTPRIDATTWRLPIGGLVREPVEFSYDDLLSMPMVERWITLSCVSNPVGGPYVSTARWLGIPLADLLDQAGIDDGAEQLFARGADGFSCSVPLEVIRDGRDALLAVGMNGEQLPFDHGFPARLIVPGLFGFVSAAKWLTELTLSTYADDIAYWTERGWATDTPALTQSRIDVPGPLQNVPAGEVTVAGMAWAQHRGVAKVEVRVDDGEWQETDLADDAGVDLWRSWSLNLAGMAAGRHDVQVRATDGTGQTQPEARTEPFPDGARGWHSVVFAVEG